MSMLSSQVDKLRELAEHLDERERGMDEYVTALRDAADTIWELRESVHRERAEADILRQQLADVTVSMGRVEERCAKFRELVGIMSSEFEEMSRCSDTPCRECPVKYDCEREMQLRHELEVEQ